MSNGDPNYLDLYDIVPRNVSDNLDFGDYQASERELITPALERLGWQVGPWYTGDGDSFGPLTRCARITKGTETKVVVYG